MQEDHIPVGEGLEHARLLLMGAEEDLGVEDHAGHDGDAQRGQDAVGGAHHVLQQDHDEHNNQQGDDRGPEGGQILFLVIIQRIRAGDHVAHAQGGLPSGLPSDIDPGQDGTHDAGDDAHYRSRKCVHPQAVLRTGQQCVGAGGVAGQAQAQGHRSAQHNAGQQVFVMLALRNKGAATG